MEREEEERNAQIAVGRQCSTTLAGVVVQPIPYNHLLIITRHQIK